MPYLYELCFRSSLEAEPLQRWVGWGPYDQDLMVWKDQTLRDGETQFFLGDAFIVGGVFEQETVQTSVYLPSCKHYEGSTNWNETYHDDGFIYLHPPYQHYPSGEWVMVPTPLSNIAVFARVGSVVPVGRPFVTTAAPELEPNLPIDAWRGVEIYPPPQSASVIERTYVGMWREDDGLTDDVKLVNEFSLSYQPRETDIVVSVTCTSRRMDIPWGSKVWIILPVGEERTVVSMSETGGTQASLENTRDARGRLMCQVFTRFPSLHNL